MSGRYDVFEGAYIPRVSPISDRAETVNHGAATVGLAASEVRPANLNRLSLSIYNGGTATVYVGNSGVTAATGMPIPAGAEREILTTSAVHAISGTAGQDVRYWEEVNA